MAILYDKLEEELRIGIDNIIEKNMEDKKKIKEGKNINLENVKSVKYCTFLHYII